MIESMRPASIISRRNGIHVTDLDGEIGMMNVDTGKYYCLDEVSAQIWRLLEAPCSVEHIVDRLREQYEIDQETCFKETLDFIASLYDNKLVDINNG